MELLPLKSFVDSINAIYPGSATVSGMKRRCEAGRLPAQKSGRAWMVITDSPEARSFVAQAEAKREASKEVTKVAGLEMNLQTAHEVNEQLNARLTAMIESNESLRNRVAELERALEVSEAKLEVALRFSGVNPNPKPTVKRAPGRSESEIDWNARFVEWSRGKPKPTIKAFAEELGVPRTTMNKRINQAKRR